MSKKIVVKLDLHDTRDKQKAMKAVSALVGIDELSMNMATQKMTVIGVVDPVDVVSKLRKSWAAASIDWVGPAKEGVKKDGADAKKEGEGEKKDGGKDESKKDGKKKPAPPTEQQLIAELVNQYRAYNPYMNTHYMQSMEEDPNSCAIC